MCLEMSNYEFFLLQSATVESDDELSSTSISKSSGNGTSAFLGNRLLMSEEFIKIQVDVKVLQVPRDNILRFIRDLGEGQFGKVCTIHVYTKSTYVYPQHKQHVYTTHPYVQYTYVHIQMCMCVNVLVSKHMYTYT